MFVNLIIRYSYHWGERRKTYYFKNKYEMFAFVGHLYLITPLKIDRIECVALKEKPTEYYKVYYTSDYNFQESKCYKGE